MAQKYELIGCFYNPKVKHKYQEETVIKIKGYPLSSLEEIDYLTASYDQDEFTKLLTKEEQDKNLFSIRVTNLKDGSFYYLKTIFNDPALKEALKDIKKKTINTASGKRNISSLSYSYPIVYNTFQPIKEALLFHDVEKLSQVIKASNDYTWKLERFINSSYELDSDREDLDLIIKEFCHYPIFRSAYIFQKEKKKIQNLKINSYPTYRKKMIVNPKQPQFNFTNYEHEYTRKINMQNEEKEEFLDEDEAEEAYGFNKEVVKRGKYHA